MKGSYTQNPKKQLEEIATIPKEEQNAFEEVEMLNSSYVNVSELIYKKPRQFVETKFLKKYISNVAAAMLRSRVGNFFISTESALFKEQMAEYFAKKISKHEILGEYVVITPDFRSEEKLFDIDIYAIFSDLFDKGYRKIILYINDFDKKCTDEDVLIFFSIIKEIKNNFKFEDIKVLATTNNKEIEFEDNSYYEPEFKYDIVFLLEPDVEQFKSLLKFKVEELSKIHGIKISSNIYEYYNLMYIVQCSENYDMSCYLDGLDYAFSVAKFKNRKRVTKLDIHDVFGTFALDELSISQEAIKEVCYHECGHYVVAKILFEDDYNFKAMSCVPNPNDCLGITIGKVKVLDTNLNNDILEKYNAYTLAGSIAEEIMGVPINSGSESDLNEAMRMTRHWLLKSGANSQIGEYCYYQKKNISNKMHEVVEEEAKSVIAISAKLCKRVLVENKAFLEELANELFVKKLLSKAAVEKIYKKHSQK